MDARAQSAILLAIVTLALAVAMLLRPSRSRLFAAFATVNGFLSAWALASFIEHLAPQSTFGMRLSVICEGAIPATALAFFLEFLGERGSGLQRALRSSLVFAGICAIVALTDLVVLKPAQWPVAPVRALIGIYALGATGLVVNLLQARMRRSVSRTEKARLLYLFVGAALTLFLVALDVATDGLYFPPLGNVVLCVYMYFLSQTLLRHRLLDLNELLGKFVVLTLLALLLAAIYGVLVSWSVGASDTGSSTGLFLFNTLVASFVVLILFEPLKAKVDGAVVSLMFPERREFLRTLSQIRVRLASVIDVRDLADALLDALHETRRITHASIYLLAPDGVNFARIGFRGPQPTASLDAASARGLVKAVTQGQKALLLENVERRLFELRSQLPGATETTRPPEMPGPALEEAIQLGEIGAALAAMRAGVCIPLLGGERVIGFLNLHDDRVPEAFASDEIAAMLDVAEHIALTVENSRLYEKMKERDRLAAIGEMAAGLAHEIRNPLSSIKGAVQVLDPKNAGPDGELVEVIVEEVNRLNVIVSQFLEYARPLRSAFARMDVNDVLTKTMRLLAGRELPANIEVKLELAPDAPGVNADADQLKQVFINLAINAAQAMPAGGTLRISTRGSRPSPLAALDSGGQVEIRFEDSGPGMSDEVRRRLFIPFFTTKEKGTGLGLAISQRIVRNHGGSVDVESRLGEGTRFIIRLPTDAARPALEGTPLPVNKPLASMVDGTPVPAIRADVTEA